MPSARANNHPPRAFLTSQWFRQNKHKIKSSSSSSVSSSSLASRALWAGILFWSGLATGSYFSFLAGHVNFSSTSSSSGDGVVIGGGGKTSHGVSSVVEAHRRDAATGGVVDGGGDYGLRGRGGDDIEEDRARADAEGGNGRGGEEGRTSEKNSPFAGVRLPDSWSSSSDARPLWITVSSHPRNDLLGAYLVPSLYLLAIANRYGWAVDVWPYGGSDAQRDLRALFELGHDIDRGWGSGFVDASSREGYDPAALNEAAHEEFGVLPEQPDDELHPSLEEWTTMEVIPTPGSKELDDLCRKNAVVGNGFVRCFLMVPQTEEMSDVQRLIKHIMKNGGPGQFFTASFRTWMRTRFLDKNQHRLKHFDENNFNVALHVRRGDVLDPMRWIEQDVYAKVARRICLEWKRDKTKKKSNIEVHIFSSGKNRDGNWDALRSVSDECGEVKLHVDEYEFDTWAHFVTADVLVLSRSSFGYVPALMNEGTVHFPFGFLHLRLPHWRRFRPEDGEEVPL